MAETTEAPDTGTFEELLANESVAETKVKVEGPEDTDSIVEKAKAKLDMINAPTERKSAEELAKMTAQIHTAEVHKSLDIQQGTVHPEHQTFGVLGMPLAAAVHDFDIDRDAQAQGSVKTKRAEDEKAIKEHNESLARIVKGLEKDAE